MDSVTIEQLKKVVSLMKENEIPPRVVKNKKEAAEFTKQDICGRKWKAGEKYYLCLDLKRTMAISDKE